MWECTIHKKYIYVGVKNSITKIASWHGAEKLEEQKRKKNVTTEKAAPSRGIAKWNSAKGHVLRAQTIDYQNLTWSRNDAAAWYQQQGCGATEELNKKWREEEKKIFCAPPKVLVTPEHWKNTSHIESSRKYTGKKWTRWPYTVLKKPCCTM